MGPVADPSRRGRSPTAGSANGKRPWDAGKNEIAIETIGNRPRRSGAQWIGPDAATLETLSGAKSAASSSAAKQSGGGGQKWRQGAAAKGAAATAKMPPKGATDAAKNAAKGAADAAKTGQERYRRGQRRSQERRKAAGAAANKAVADATKDVAKSGWQGRCRQLQAGTHVSKDGIHAHVEGDFKKTSLASR